jgi:DNA modification methylase
MKKDSLSLEEINANIKKIEKDFNKIDEWIIPRDRESFYLTHDFHPYFAAYPPVLVSKLLEKYSQEGDSFLDPFMGGGSSIVEGFILKRKTFGLDISPFSKFISETKTTPIEVTDKEINTLLGNIKDDILKHKLNDYDTFNYAIPPVINIDKWFIKESKYDLAIILHHIKKISNINLRNFYLLAFSSIIRRVSNAKNAQQHLCEKKDKKIPAVYPLFEKKIILMSQQMKDYISKLKNLENYSLPVLYIKDIRKMEEVIREESIDIIITSPPYGTGSRYTDVNRLSFEWLELIKPSREETMETSKDFKFELKKALEQIYKVLKKGKYCFLVYGDPTTEGSLTKAAIEDAKNIGFDYEGLISCPIEKTIKNHHEKYRRFIPKDFILIFKKPN